MKFRYYLLLPFLFTFSIFNSQGLPSSENYTTSRTYLEAVTSTNPSAKQNYVVHYLDGLGRSKQIINVKGSPLNNDIVKYIEYDVYGKHQRDYLPLPQAASQNGNRYSNPLVNAANIYGSEKIYSEKITEKSPLNRLKQHFPEGQNWSSHPVTYSSDSNHGDAVKKFEVNTTWDDGICISTLVQSSLNGGHYPDGELFKNSKVDEDGNRTIDYSDRQGKIIMSRKNDGQNNLDTYNVYNEYDELVYVIPPLADGSVLNQNIMDHLCYQYRYDGRKRLAEKKIPGKGWESLVYDTQNRLIMSQDAKLKEEGKWIFTKYDQFGRITFTGITLPDFSTSRGVHQTNADNAGVNNTYRYHSMTISYSNHDLQYTVTATYPHYTNISALLSVNYYDYYPVDSPSAPATILSQAVLPVLGQNINSTINTKSLPLASFIKNIENDIWTKNYTYYDMRGRRISTLSNNNLGGYTRDDLELDFSGVIKTKVRRHKMINSDVEKVISEQMTYDQKNRLTIHTHQIDGKPREFLYRNRYNELSQLETKLVGGKLINLPLQVVDYKYNIRGWLTMINDPDNLGNDFFGYKIKYDSVEGLETPYYEFPNHKVKPRFNGNISEIDWKTATVANNNLKRYGYAYDKMDRLTAGFFQKDVNPSLGEFFEVMTYDFNGNIKTLQRTGAANSGTTIKEDYLVYNYKNNNLSNVLESVHDVSQNVSGYPYYLEPNHMDHDLNGNMTKNVDYYMSKISYNHLNLPTKYEGFDAFNYNYKYRADGVKTEKQLYFSIPNITEKIYYFDGFQYKDDGSSMPSLKFLHTSEGYFDYNKDAYVYNYLDHLGNVRLSYEGFGAAGKKIIQENNYYPFGSKHSTDYLFGNYLYTYQYGGKERQETGLYDFGARSYSPEIGRWTSIDPLADLAKSISPYRYGFNNPIYYSDPTGKFEDCPKCPEPRYADEMREAEDGYTYAATPIREGATQLEWLRKTDIEEVSFVGKSDGAYHQEDFYYDNDLEGTTGYKWHTLGFNKDGEYGAIESNLSLMDFSYSNTSGSGSYPLAFNLGAKGAIMSSKVSARAGTKNWHLKGEAEGKMWSAHGNIGAGIFTGEEGKIGPLINANVGAQMLEGEVSGTITLFGISFRSTVGGSFVSAHIGGTAGAYYDESDGSFNIQLQENIGLGIGEKAEIDIKIPMPFIEK